MNRPHVSHTEKKNMITTNCVTMNLRGKARKNMEQCCAFVFKRVAAAEHTWYKMTLTFQPIKHFSFPFAQKIA